MFNAINKKIESLITADIERRRREIGNRIEADRIKELQRIELEKEKLRILDEKEIMIDMLIILKKVYLEVTGYEFNRKETDIYV